MEAHANYMEGKNESKHKGNDVSYYICRDRYRHSDPRHGIDSDICRPGTSAMVQGSGL